MLFLDNAAPDSCCAERPLHIPTYPRLVSTAATVRECGNRDTDRPTRLPSLRMCARGLINNLMLKKILRMRKRHNSPAHFLFRFRFHRATLVSASTSPALRWPNKHLPLSVSAPSVYCKTRSSARERTARCVRPSWAS